MFLLGSQGIAHARVDAISCIQVREEVLPEFGLDLSRLLSAFAPVRKFGPVQRKVLIQLPLWPWPTHAFGACLDLVAIANLNGNLWPGQAAPIVNHPKTVLLCVTIMKATNLPERAEIAGGPSRQATTRPSHGRALMDPGSGAYGGGFSARQSRSR